MAAKKRMTKQKREELEVQALTQRITDIYSGAGAGLWISDERWPTATELSYIVPAVKETFGLDYVPEWIWGPHNLDRFEEPRKVAMLLHAHGVRA